ncbi:hypothetical protein [Sphingorhabdus sp.]|uniref:hypothetical protein n=1 Tax=Sphingorhabdus sp. TaxID=1902408 RepID=UPI0035931282
MNDDQAEICWDKLYAEVNAWRGECMHHIAVAERAITETLLVLDGAKPDGTKFPLRHLIGHRFEDISAATGPDGPFAEEGKAAHKAIENYRRHEAFRTLLCHGVAQVTVTRGGAWLLIIRSLSIRPRQAEETTAIFEKSVAEEKLVQLKSDGQKLASNLGQLRKKLQVKAPV